MAQTQQIRMSLMFDVNSSKAKASLQDLQKSLNGLTSNIGKGELKLTSDVQEAYVAAEKLKRVLNESVNMNTGQFDLSKFQYQLKQSGMSVQSLSADFAKAGSQGVQAFNSLASAIANAEIPTKRMNKVLDQMVKSFKDTMRWQISSSVVHGLTGALQSAYGYAQDLNRSLNDIRIVTGYNEEYMAKFAKEANNAAKALSSTTNEYAKAALIFYQQGTLTDNQIAERTAATIKMANVTGEAAKDISSYMTAIWNNFDDGTKSIEYYADAITALGAATASSSEEIATGMQKFAAIGKTVGLSYDYAASALATVVAATRQSEETVGISFKTIFSRLQSLQLGETLEDDTTLAKYTAALAKVGVDIKLGNGELKQMDDIIDELGNKWAQLNQEQKTALAYTVAGSRQYTNFISLMDNYETFKVNVDIAADAEGTLDEQQKIYAESWEAAANRVRAAAEGIFQDLIDDKFFIDLLNGAEKLLSMLDLFMDSIGGLPGVLSLVSSLMLKIFNSQVTQSVRDIGYGLSHFLGIAQAKAGKTKEEFTTEASKLTKKMRVDTVGDPMLNAELDSMSYRIQLEQEYIALESTLTEHQKEQYKIQMSLLDVMREQKKEKLEAMEAAKDELSSAGIATIKGAKRTKEAVSASEEAWTAKQMGRLADASSAEAAAGQKAQNAFDIVAARQSQADEEREALENAVAKRDQLKLQHANVNQQKGAGFGNTRFGQSGAEAEADKQLARDYQAAEKLVQALESRVARAEEELATAQSKAREAQATFYEALTEKIEVANKIANEEMPDFSAANPAEVGATLKKYIAYSTGRNDMLEKGITDMLDGLSTISREDMTPEEYKKRLEDIATELRDFQDDYYVELGENTQEVIDSIIKQLETNWNEDGVDISSDDIQKFTDRISEASKKDEAIYRTGTTGEDGRIERQGSAREIWDAMKAQGVALDENNFAEFEEGYKKYAKTVREVRRVTDKELDGVKNAYEKLYKSPEKLYDFADRITGLAQVVSNLGLAFNSVKGAWDAMSNPDLSGWERFMAVFTALSTVVGSVMSTMQLLSKFKAGENEKTAKETLITWLNTIAQKENAKARRDNAAAADQQGKEIAETTATKVADTAADVMGEGVERATNAEGKVLEGVGKEAKGMPKGSQPLAKSGQTLGQAFSKALPQLGPIIGGVALIAAGVLVLAAAITITVKGYNKARDAAKKAAETAQHFSEVATEAQQKYNDTVETISSYKEALTGMEELTKGTEEWDKALLETNQTAFELINQFDELAGKYHFENGQVVFDEGALEEVQAAQLAEAQDAQAASMAANIAARKAEANADRIDMARDLNSSGDTWKKLGNAAAATGVAMGSGALIGAGAGLIAGGGVFSWASTGIGAAIGAVAGLTTGVIMATQDLTSTVDELDAMDELVALYGKNPSAFENEAEFRKALASTSIDLNDEILVDSLMKNREELSKTVAALYANEQAVKAETQAMIAAANADNKNYTESKYSDYLAVFGQQVADEEGDDSKRAEIEADVKDLWKGSNTKEGGFWDTYLEEMYGKDADQYRIKDAGGGNVTLQKKSEDGTWETQGEKNSLSEKAAEAALIEKKLAELSDKEIADFEKKAEKIENNLKNSGLSQNAIHQAGLAYADNRAIDLSTLTGAQLDNINFKAITDTNLREAMRTAAANAEESWKKILANYSSHVVDELNKFDTAITSKGYDVTREQLDLYAEALQDFTQVAGPQAATVFNENLVRVMDENSEKAVDIMNLVAEIDWSNPQIGLNKFAKGMDALGVSINAYSWEVDGISATLGEMAINNGLITDSEYLVELFKQLNSLAGKLTLGGILDGYAKDALIDSGLADSYDFLDTYDGQYKYVGEKYKYTDKLAYDTAVAMAMAGEDTARKNELYTDFKERSKTVKSNDPKSLLKMLNGMTDEEYRLFVGKSLGADGPATRADAISQISGARKAQRDVENWKGYTRTYNENYWNNQRTSAARKMATEYIEQNLDSHWFDDYSNAQQYTLAKEYYTEPGEFDKWFKDQKKPGGILPFAIGAGQQGGESEEQYRQRVDDYFNRVIAVNENSEGAIDALTSDLLAASKEGYWSSDVFGGNLAARYQDYFTNENGILDPEGELETLLTNYTNTLANIDSEQQKSVSDVGQYAELTDTLSKANGLFTNMYTIFTNAASDPSDIEGFKSDEERVDAFKGVIGGASSIGDLQTLRDNEVFASLFEREDVQKTYDIAVRTLKRMNAEELSLLDSLEDEKNKREQINTNLEHTKNLYDKISSADLVANLTQQRTETELLIEQDKEILEGTKGQYRRQRKKLRETIGKDVAQVITDDEGNILNYEEIRRAAGEKYGYNSQQYADIVKQLEEYKATGQEITELNEKIAENTNWIQNYWVHVGEGITAYIDGINSSISSSTGVINHYKNVIGLVGEEVLGINSNMLDEIRAGSQASANAALNAQKQQYELIRSAREQAEAELAYASEEEYATRLKALEDLQKQEEAAFNSMNESFSAALEQAASNFADKIADITKNFEKSMTGAYGTFEEMQQRYSQLSTLDDQYLDDYKKLYELSKLSRDLDKSIASTNSVKGKQELGALQQKLVNMQAEGSQISEHDLEVAQKEYELTLAKIALEDAQNAKSQVRLQKMANGSWGYVYTQNEDSIAAAEQSYEDKVFALRDSNEKYLDQLGQQTLELEAEMMSELNKIAGMTNLSEEQRQAEMEKTIDFYKQRLGFVTSEIDKTLAYNQEILGTAGEFPDTLLGIMYPDMDSASSIYEQTVAMIGDEESGLLGEMITASQGYADEIANIFDITGQTVGGFATKVAEDLGDITTALNDSIAALTSYTQLQTRSWETNRIAGIDRQGNEITRGQLYETVRDQYKIYNQRNENETAADYETRINNALFAMTDSELAKYWNSMVGLSHLGGTKGYDYIDIKKFDTGGYTGEWGPEGRLAMLHEKELVLNAADTQNLLHIMEIMDQVIKNIDLSASAAASSRIHSPGIASMNSTLEQQVTIHAEFPNATNHSEIEQAFDTLINRATQYSNRR